MKIVVCVKHVPDMQSQRHFVDKRIVRGEDDVLNEVDENAIETAVTIAEEHDDVEVLALTIGPEDSADALRRALQMGADNAIHICDDYLENSDVLTTSKVLAKAIEQIGNVDLIITGMTSSDGNTSLVPSYLASNLGLPLLSFAKTLEKKDEKIVITRSVDGIEQSLSAKLPLIVSVSDQINEPRYPNFKAIAAARKKPIEEWDLSELGLESSINEKNIEVISIEEKPAREKGQALLNSPVAVKQLAEFIKEKVK
ncbi:electron transfer flavoprotein subunit beta/FixA family protein [Actinomyces sp. zg-332]|uniref:electron transfer flavoprotein subunit beta/FixA family protein n=1 Tax=Actinomyces sp. zg-332 TaxID=2708340 RepID=UPI0014219E22|nr:electron transfer flavoprotein subunit beta/FixA family protein [Actinomyces sp. zg-332]QPK93834.1 electron transfer flavoprotein subunit beta/FixA family protein [Actinomyces sp. zg-332]